MGKIFIGKCLARNLPKKTIGNKNIAKNDSCAKKRTNARYTSCKVAVRGADTKNACAVVRRKACPSLVLSFVCICEHTLDARMHTKHLISAFTTIL